MAAAHDPDGMLWLSHEGALPLVLGLGGHRDLRPEDLPQLEGRLGDVLADLRQRYPHTPLILLSSLAEGADRLGARVAVANGVGLVAPLPLPPDEYSQDFSSAASRAEFRDLLGKAADWLVVPGESDDGRDRRYARAAAYIAHRSHLVVALWDGSPARTEAGTAALVTFALQGIPGGYRESRSALDIEERRPVIQIVTPRARDFAAAPDPPFSVHYRYPAGYGDAAGAPHIFQETWRRLDTFNRDVIRLSATGKHNVLGHALLSSEDSARLPKHLQALERCYVFADILSLRFQRFTHGTLKGLIALGVVAAFSFQVDQLAKPPTPALRIVSFGALIGAYFWWLWSRRSRWQIRHLDYRALAEGLRVQFFWRLAGLDDSAADHYLRKQRSELDWVRRAVRVWDVGTLLPPSDTIEARLQLVLQYWVRPQRTYFTPAAKRNDRRTRIIRYSGFTFLAVTIGLACTTLLVGGAYPLLAASSLVPAIWAFVQFYADKTALAPLAKQYARMSYGFAVAEDVLAASLQVGDHRRAQKLLSELGVEALAENGDWVLLYRERPLDVPRPN